MLFVLIDATISDELRAAAGPLEVFDQMRDQKPSSGEALVPGPVDADTWCGRSIARVGAVGGAPVLLFSSGPLLRLVPFSALAEGMVFLLGPGWLDVEQFEDLALGVGEAVEADAVGGVGDA